MKIVLNGKPLETEAANLKELCLLLGFNDAKIATAINGNFVPENQKQDTRLNREDKIEIVSPRQGG